MKIAESIIQFWFGDNPSIKTRGSFWYKSNPETDNIIQKKFENVLLLAKEKKLEHWKNKPLGRLALIILCDQFPRNIYRKKAQAFSFDKIALENTLEGIKQKQEQKLMLLQKHFFYMPLMHAEDLKIQKLSLKIFAKLNKEQNIPDNTYAQQHYNIIEKFGRFPYRNKALGRISTPEELEFLKTADRFGQ